MAISDRITSIEEHIKESYQELEGIGIDTTGVNKNLENIPKLIDGYWETLPKVTGEGTSITLDNTKEGKMKIDLKGNTSQATTAGKNLLINVRDEGYTVTSNGITFKVNADKSITITGTATNVASMSLNTGTPVTLTAGTYTLSKKETTDVQVAIWYDSASVFTSVRGTNNTIQKTVSQDTTYNNWRTLVVVYQGVTVNTTVYPMLEKSSTETPYEPYTNGASPNPDYPQDIHVVSGDNDIIVRGNGKNLFNKDFHIINGFYINGSGGITSDSTLSYQDYFIEVEQNTEYTISSNVSTIYRIAKYDSSKNFINRPYNENASTSYTINTGNAKYIKMAGTLTTALDSLQIEKNSSATTYEPYIGATYPVNLPVENLLPNTGITETNNGITFTKNADNTITLNGTATADTYTNVWYNTTNNLINDTNQVYTMSIGLSNSNVGLAIFEYINNGWVNKKYVYAKSTTYTPSGNQTGQIFRVIVKNGATLNNVIVKPMLEVGTKVNTYVPYGTTPIELCKIGDYQDSIKKSTGKNLINFNNLNDVTLRGVTTSYLGSKFKINGTTNEAGVIIVPSDLNITIPAGTYTLTFAVESGSNTGVGSGKDIAFYLNKSNATTIADRLATITIGQLNTNNKYSVTFTTNEEVPLYIYVYGNNSGMTFNNYVVQVQLEKGTQSTSFEPYGTGWYLKNEIGKVVFTGANTEIWSKRNDGDGSTTITFQIPGAFGLFGTNSEYCNRFVYEQSSSSGNEGIGISSEKTFVYIQIKRSRLLSLDEAGFKSWLSTHNTTVYYILSTPTYTEITNSTLLSQLNALAKSYASQTNISQESNDLASLLNATALSE